MKKRDKILIGCRWQYRWKVFNNQVLQTYWIDLQDFLTYLILIIVSFVFLFSLPIRILVWLFEPFWSIVIRKDISDRAYEQMDDMLKKNK